MINLPSKMHEYMEKHNLKPFCAPLLFFHIMNSVVPSEEDLLVLGS
jgi:hypothetical protein